MPIQCALDILPVTREEFHAIDRIVTGVAFEGHNKFGRFLDESLHQDEMTARCETLGLQVSREMLIRVTHETFVKNYFVDMLVTQGVVIETKAVTTLTQHHISQTLHYLFLTESHHGSLINLRPSRVDRRFVSTSLTKKERCRFRIVDKGWNPVMPECHQIRVWILALLEDWGAFLDFRLYRDAITHFLGGSEKVLKRLPVTSGSRVIGQQHAHMLTNDFAFALSATKKDWKGMIDHQQRFLKHTSLAGIIWINLNRHDIEFTNTPKDP
jgi:GxxExxY protein